MVTETAIDTVTGMAALRATAPPITQGSARMFVKICIKVTVISSAWLHRNPRLRYKLLAFLPAAKLLSAESPRSELQQLFRTIDPTTFIATKVGMFIAKPNRVGNNAQKEVGRTQNLRSYPLNRLQGQLLSNLTAVTRTGSVVRKGPAPIDNLEEADLVAVVLDVAEVGDVVESGSK